MNERRDTIHLFGVLSEITAAEDLTTRRHIAIDDLVPASQRALRSVLSSDIGEDQLTISRIRWRHNGHDHELGLAAWSDTDSEHEAAYLVHNGRVILAHEA